MRKIIFLILVSVLATFSFAGDIVTLNDVVAGFDRGESSEEGLVFPMRLVAHSGEAYLNPFYPTISENCADWISISNDEPNNEGLFCDPYGDATKRFQFARVTRNREESDGSSWIIKYLEFSPGVRLDSIINETNGDISYFLEIAE